MRRSGPSCDLSPPLSLSLFATHRSLSLSLSLSLAPSPFVRLSHSACSGDHSLLSFVHPSPSRSLPPPELSIMTPRGGTIPEVKSERRNHDVHSMESLSSAGTGYSKVATHGSLSRVREGKSASLRPARARHSRERESRASSCRGEKSCRVDISFSSRGGSPKVRRFREESRLGSESAGILIFDRDVNTRSDVQGERKIERRTKDRGKSNLKIQEQ